jgi:hypothetical protein
MASLPLSDGDRESLRPKSKEDEDVALKCSHSDRFVTRPEEPTLADPNRVVKGLRVAVRARAAAVERGGGWAGKDEKGMVRTSSWVVQIVNIFSRETTHDIFTVTHNIFNWQP